MEKLLTLLLSCLLAGCISLAGASPELELNVISCSSGERLPTWHHNGRLYVAGASGERYRVEMHNRSGRRLLAVLAVDGVNAISGETATPGQSGYVLEPGRRLEVAGWRKSLDQVAAFYFTTPADSYAALTARPDNVGVIGVAVYREAGEPAPVPLISPALAPQAVAAPVARAIARLAGPGAEEGLGTGHGQRLEAPARAVEFLRASTRPSTVITLYYDSAANLRAHGIIPALRFAPDPFPAGFVADPRG